MCPVGLWTVQCQGGVGLGARLRPFLRLGAHQKLTTSNRTELTTSKTHVATWHGTASVSSSPAPLAHKFFSRYGGGVLIRAARPLSSSTSPGADFAKSGPDWWSTFGEQGWVISCERRSSGGGRRRGAHSIQDRNARIDVDDRHMELPQFRYSADAQFAPFTGGAGPRTGRSNEG